MFRVTAYFDTLITHWDPSLSGTLAVAGGLWASRQVYDLASFVYLHFIRRSSLERYKQSNSQGSAWALVTGASDGIGRGFAEELCHCGFNVILHGRNENKLQGVKDALLKQWPEREIRILIIDALNDSGSIPKLEAAAAQLKDINLKILVNNVGGSAGMPSFTALEKRTGSEVTKYIDLNAHFPTQITRVLLPLLIRQNPALIINIGSGASEAPGPYLSVYSGSKAFNKAWSRSLGAEMKAEGHDVEVICILIGLVATDAMQKAPSLSIPSPRQMAKSSLNVVGSGQSEVWAYWPHALQFGLILSLPKWMVETAVTSMVRKEKAIVDARSKDR